MISQVLRTNISSFCGIFSMWFGIITLPGLFFKSSLAFNTGIGRFLLRPSPKAAKLVLPRSFIKNVVHKLNLDITEISSSISWKRIETSLFLLIKIPKNWLSILTQGEILISKMPINGHRFALIYLHWCCVSGPKSPPILLSL